jgi:hypothetical protein
MFEVNDLKMNISALQGAEEQQLILMQNKRRKDARKIIERKFQLFPIHNSHLIYKICFSPEFLRKRGMLCLMKTPRPNPTRLDGKRGHHSSSSKFGKKGRKPTHHQSRGKRGESSRESRPAGASGSSSQIPARYSANRNPPAAGAAGFGGNSGVEPMNID